ncbi:MAG: hypothetical protein KDK78_12120, partial [Chlamydiia bacterium]|nr:hypothetical protein [Chlamydiia bacterium]
MTSPVMPSPLEDKRLWELVRSEADPCGQHITFQLKEKYQRDAKLAQAAKDALFPASEPLPSNLPPRFDEHAEQFKALGYQWEGNTLILPDRDALQARWEHLRTDRPDLHLPEISIYSCPEGKAEDADFLFAHLRHDAVLSEGDEFVHDHIYHLVPMFRRIFEDSARYPVSRANLVNDLRFQLGRIGIYRQHGSKQMDETIKKIEAILAMQLDGLMAKQTWQGWSERLFSLSIGTYLYGIARVPNWREYWKTRHGPINAELFNEMDQAERLLNECLVQQ